MGAIEEVHCSQCCGKADNWNKLVPVQNCGQVTKCLLSTEVHTGPKCLDGHDTIEPHLEGFKQQSAVAIPPVIMFICKSV